MHERVRGGSRNWECAVRLNSAALHEMVSELEAHGFPILVPLHEKGWNLPAGIESRVIMHFLDMDEVEVGRGRKLLP